MAEELLLVNPRKRRAKRAKRRSPAQVVATRKLVSSNRTRRRRRKNKTQKVAGYYPNPSPRRSRRRSISLKSLTRRRRRNPIGGTGNLMSMLKECGTGAVGAVVNDLAVKYIPLPVTMKVGYTGYAVKGLSAIMLGMLGKKVLGRTAETMAKGALTVTLYDMTKGLAAKAGVSLSGVGYMGPAMIAGNRNRQLPRGGMSEYVVPDHSNLSEYV